MQLLIAPLLFFCWLFLLPLAAAEEQKEPSLTSCTLQAPPLVKWITFKPPPGWRQLEANQLPESVKAMVVGQGKGSVPPSINLSLEHYAGTIETYLNTIDAINRSRGTPCQRLSTLDTPAGRGYLLQVIDETNWGAIQLIHLVLLDEGMIYLLTAAAPKEEFGQYYPLFFDAMKSLQFVR